jgi:glycosyltransferase involved in cell wall biosynthesis
MQEIKKRSIVLASVLKPADDTRMLEKMAVSLANTARWKVYVLGSGTQVPNAPGISFYLLGAIKRVSVKRILLPWRVFRLLFQLKPEQVVITTHELLFSGIFYKLLTGSRLYYDVQENYRLNILNTRAFPPVLKFVIASYVRAVEWCAAPFINHFFLAEKTYATELSFIGRKFTILENKALLPAYFHRQVDTTRIKLLFTGTLDHSTGVFQAITLAQKLNEISGNVSLTIMGFASSDRVRNEIRESVKVLSYIEVIGIDHPVPHSQILQAIRSATAGIIYYPPAQHTAHRIPTKLYEYLAAQLPMLYDSQASWKSLVQQWQAGIAVDFESPNHQAILAGLRSTTFYPDAPEGVFWEPEKLIQSLQ